MTDTTRKLATIVALDVAGYSARTEADEAGTTAEVAALRKVIEAIAARHGGRVFNTAGDGFMLEFGSSLSAVEAAFALAETCEPKVRVGVHLGDVVVQPNGDLLGHGVNVAARLMARSDPGSVLVSADVRRTIRGPLAERLQSRGLLKLDKMAETIEAFALKTVTAAPKVPDVFLSYAREDQLIAQRFAQAFQQAGLTVWWDVTLRPGDAYDEVMEAALKAAKAVVVLWSKRSAESRWVRAEATHADRNKTLVPAMIEPCERPIMFELTQTADLAHWQGDATDKAWASFLADVKRLVQREPVLDQTRVESILPGETTWSETGAVAQTGERGEAPSLAVLPFTSRSGVADDEVFAEGMVEDVIAALSQSASVRVLSSVATANLRKGATGDLTALGQQLGVRYFLEGNVRRVGVNLRMTAQLLEADSGQIVWTQKFDRPLAELSGLQEDLVMEIAAHLGSHLNRMEMQRALKKPSSTTAWEAAMRAVGALHDPSSDNVARMLREARRAVSIAPDYGLAQAILTLAEGVQYNTLSPIEKTTEQRIRGRAEKAIALDQGNAQVLGYVSCAMCLINLPEESLQYAGRALQLNPSNDWALQSLAGANSLLGREDEAVSNAEAFVRLAPGSHLTWIALSWAGAAHVRAGHWDQARVVQARTVSFCPTGAQYLIQLAITCSVLGRNDEALAYTMRAREAEPGLRPEQMEWRLRRWQAGSPSLEASLQHLHHLWAQSEQAS